MESFAGPTLLIQLNDTVHRIALALLLCLLVSVSFVSIIDSSPSYYNLFLDSVHYASPLFAVCSVGVFVVIALQHIFNHYICAFLGREIEKKYPRELKPSYHTLLSRLLIYVVYFSMAITFCAALYFRKGLLRHIKKDLYSSKLKRLLLDSKRIAQVLFLDFDKGYHEHLNLDVGLNMAAYISKPTDEVHSYCEKYRWLERFILPFDLETSNEISEDFHDAHVAFELAPAEFAEHIERFSELLETRDICKLLFRYLGEIDNKDNRYSMLQFWVPLQAAIFNIITSVRSSNIATTIEPYDQDLSDRLGLSLQ